MTLPSNTGSRPTKGCKGSPSGPPGQHETGNTSHRVLDTQQLFLGDTIVHLNHQGEWYRLQVTRQGKLILTK